MKLMLSGIVLLALVTACGDDSSTDGDTTEDSGASETTSDDEETTSDDEETTSDDEETNDAAAADDEETSDDTATADASAPPMFPPPPDPISCGDVACPGPPWGTPCCVTAADVEAGSGLTEGACGVDMSSVFEVPSACVEFNQPGDLDESCPAFEPENAPPSPGCCTTHGFCGTVDTFTGLGCVSTPPELGGVLIPCGDGQGDAGSTSEGDAGSGSGGDAGSSTSDEDASTSEPDAGDATEEPSDAGSSSEPTLDASMSTDAAADASL